MSTPTGMTRWRPLTSLPARVRLPGCHGRGRAARQAIVRLRPPVRRLPRPSGEGFSDNSGLTVERPAVRVPEALLIRSNSQRPFVSANDYSGYNARAAKKLQKKRENL